MVLEQYLSPLLMNYISQYVHNLNPGDFNLTLWSGDVVLKNIELKHEALERHWRDVVPLRCCCV